MDQDTGDMATLLKMAGQCGGIAEVMNIWKPMYDSSSLEMKQVKCEVLQAVVYNLIHEEAWEPYMYIEWICAMKWADAGLTVLDNGMFSMGVKSAFDLKKYNQLHTVEFADYVGMVSNGFYWLGIIPPAETVEATMTAFSRFAGLLRYWCVSEDLNYLAKAWIGFIVFDNLSKWEYPQAVFKSCAVAYHLCDCCQHYLRGNSLSGFGVENLGPDFEGDGYSMQYCILVQVLDVCLPVCPIELSGVYKLNVVSLLGQCAQWTIEFMRNTSAPNVNFFELFLQLGN